MQPRAVYCRENFSPLAAFFSDSTTNAQGTVTFDFTMPDNLTRYRLMVYAVEHNRFGITEDSVTARLPIMLRPSPPRYLLSFP